MLQQINISYGKFEMYNQDANHKWKISVENSLFLVIILRFRIEWIIRVIVNCPVSKDNLHCASRAKIQHCRADTSSCCSEPRGEPAQRRLETTALGTRLLNVWLGARMLACGVLVFWMSRRSVARSTWTISAKKEAPPRSKRGVHHSPANRFLN
jgi:hypothetical protein